MDTVCLYSHSMHPSERTMNYPLRQNYRPSKHRAPAWLARLWRWL